MTRLKYPNLSSVSTGVTATLTLNGTTVTWSADPKIPTVAAPDIFPVIFQPNSASAEVGYITAHTAGATTSTVLRLAEPLAFGASTAAAMSAVAWAHGATVPDLTANFGGGSLLGQALGTGNQVGEPASLTILEAALAVTFTTPPSGRVRVVLRGLAHGGTGWAGWGLMEGAATVAVARTVGTYTINNVVTSAEFLITGLVPGSVHTYSFAHQNLAGTGNSTVTYATEPAISVHDASAGGQGVGAASGVLRGDAGWTTPTLLNGWANYGSGYVGAQFRKDAAGYVHLEGSVTGAAKTSNTIFQLPTGYRPGEQQNQRSENVTLALDGTVQSSATGLISLDGITFLAAGETGQLHDGGGTGGVVTPLLGLKSYAAAADGATYTFGVAFADLDTTNLAVTFTAPASGKVKVNLAVTVNGNASDVYFGLAEGGTAIAATSRLVAYPTGEVPASIPIYISGLTPGSQHTYTWQAKRPGGAGGAVYTGPGYGPAVISVEDAGIGTAGTNLASPVNLLGITSYTPPGGDTTSYTITSTTIADVDATNLLVTFTAPQSGRVLVKVNAAAYNGGRVYFGLREGTTVIAQTETTATAQELRSTPEFLITGLTPGSVHTYKFGVAADSGGVQIKSGPTFGPIVLSVLDATVGLGGSGALVNSNKLAVPVVYATGTDVNAYTIATGSTLVDVDATNLAVTFTAPSSGKVLVRTNTPMSCAGGGSVYIGLREGTSVVAGPVYLTGEPNTILLSKPFLVSGLTPGSVHTYKLAAYATGGTGAIYLGPTYGSVTMEVEDAAVAAAGIGGVPGAVSVSTVIADDSYALACPTGAAARIPGASGTGNMQIVVPASTLDRLVMLKTTFTFAKVTNGIQNVYFEMDALILPQFPALGSINPGTYTVVGMAVVPGDSATHTIDVHYEAATDTSTITWHARSIKAWSVTTTPALAP